MTPRQIETLYLLNAGAPTPLAPPGWSRAPAWHPPFRWAGRPAQGTGGARGASRP